MSNARAAVSTLSDVLRALVGYIMATLMVELQSNHHHNCYYQMPEFKITAFTWCTYSK